MQTNSHEVQTDSQKAQADLKIGGKTRKLHIFCMSHKLCGNKYESASDRNKSEKA